MYGPVVAPRAAKPITIEVNKEELFVFSTNRYYHRPNRTGKERHEKYDECGWHVAPLKTHHNVLTKQTHTSDYYRRPHCPARL